VRRDLDLDLGSGHGIPSCSVPKCTNGDYVMMMWMSSKGDNG